MAVIFISYRRDDEAGFAGRIADALDGVFGADVVFRDREDIAPGDDFAKVIDRRLRQASVTIVVIGPGWLDAGAAGKRRLDAADDFVALEVRRAIESGKPVIPVLVAGAQMPSERDLPPALVRLARRQAIVLSDANWAADLARLVDALRLQLPANLRRPQRPQRTLRARWPALAAFVLAVALALSLYAFWIKPAGELKLAQEISGRWLAEVRYDWGDVYEETFNLHVEATEVRGTASYLRWPRLIEGGAVGQGRQFGFVTHSVETLGSNAPRTVTHRYRGRLTSDGIAFVLETSGGDTPHTPVAFVARRTAQ